MPKLPALFNWSGGKDSTLALHYILETNKFEVCYLLTSINNTFNRVSMHGVREALLLTQVNRLAIPLMQVRLPEMPDMEIYERELTTQLNLLKNEGIYYSIFGDIFLEDLKTYRENQLAKIGMQAVFPLWKKDSLELVKEFIDLGYRAIVVCAQNDLEDFCGRIIDQSFLNDLPVEIDPCGENGEFHSFVFDGPIFSAPIEFSVGEKVYKTYPAPNNNEQTNGYWFVDLIPVG